MNLFELFVKIGVDDQASGKLKSLSSKLGSGLKTAAKVGATAVAAASTAVVAFGGSSVKAGMDFDSAMSQVAATMGKTTDEIVELRDFAQEMGSTTAFSATQAADALNYMALAGYDAETSMNMLPNVLNLAAAGGIELAYASDMVTDAQSALGLSLEETSAMVDKMAKASSKTNTSVQQMGEAILTVGGTAKNLKGGTTELTQVLGLLADNGIKGAEGGTHLRNILLAMQPTTDAAAAAFERLNLQTYDADGSLRNLEDIFLDMNAAMDGMTDQEKQNIITSIFNKTDLSSVNALLATTEERWDAVSDAIDDSAGAAQAMANTQLDNLNGDITLFKSALEGAQIAISDKLTPTLRSFVQFGSKGLSELTEGFKEGGLSGAMEALGSLLGEGLTMIAESLPDIVKAGVSLLEALIQGISENGDLIITAAFDAVMVLADGILSMLPQIVKLGLDLIVSLANGITEALPELIPTIIDVVLQIVDTLTNPETLMNIIEAGIELLLGLIDGIVGAIPELIRAVPKIIASIVTVLIAELPTIISAAIEIVFALIDGLIGAIPELVAAIPNLIIGIVNGLLNNLDKIILAAPQIILSLAKGLIGAIPELLLYLPRIIKSIVKTFMDYDWGSIGKNIVDGLLGGLKKGWTSLKKWFSNAWDSLFGASEDKLEIGSPSKRFKRYGKWTAEGFGIGFEDEFADVSSDIEDSFADLGADTDYGITTSSTSISDFGGGSSAYGYGGSQNVNVTVGIDDSANAMGLARALLPFLKIAEKEVYA